MALKNLDRALRNAFDKRDPKQFPHFTKKGRTTNSFRYPDSKQFKLDGSRIFLPKIGWVRFYKSLEIEGPLKNVTVSRTGKHWFVSVQVEIGVSEPIHLDYKEAIHSSTGILVSSQGLDVSTQIAN